METTDLHMQLDAFDYLRDATGQRYGLAGLEPVIANARAEGIETVLCDNGDFLQGNPLADLLAADTSGAIHPIIGAFNALNYDVITLGNHEFNYGLKRLLEVLNHAEAHVVSANLRTSPRTLLINPWTIITRQLHCSDGSVRPIRVGVIGFVMPKVEKWDCIDPSEPIFSDDVVEAARTALPSLKRAKADIIVALCHSGIGSAQHVNGMENAAIPLSAIPEIDVLLTGHTHDVFPDPDFAHLAEADTIKGTLNGTPTVMAGSYGSHLGLIDLALEHRHDVWRVVGHQSELRPSSPPAIRVKSPNLERAHQATRAHLSETLARSTAPLNSHFAVIGYDPASELNAKSKIAAVTAFQEKSEFAGLPLLGAASSFRMGGRSGPHNYLTITDGQLTRRTVAAITPFNNPVCAILQRGWQLRAWLEHTSQYFNQIVYGQPNQTLVNASIPSFHFDTLYGLTYQFDLSQSGQEGRVRNLRFQGAPVLDDDIFVVATDSYLANGGGGREAVHVDDLLYQSPLGVAAALTQYLQNHPAVTPTRSPVWSFTPMADTGVVFQSAPHASASSAPLPLIQLANDELGFSQFRMTF